MNEQYDGKDAVAVDGDRIGQIDRSFLDDKGVVRMIEVRLAGGGAHTHLVPVEGASFEEHGVRVPYTRAQINDSPPANAEADELEGAALDRIQDYYERLSATEGSPRSSVTEFNSEGLDPTAIRDVGDYIEIPLVEEVLVKQQVVREVIRVRKTELVSTEDIEGTVRVEDIEVDTAGGLETPEVRDRTH